MVLRGRLDWADLLMWTAAATLLLLGVSRWRAAVWILDVQEEEDTDESSVTRLGLDPAAQIARARMSTSPVRHGP